jgi:hypothetical protein
MAPSFEVLPGLPAEGPYPEQFSGHGGTHREGFVVRVFPDRSAPWVGNFQAGLGGVSRVVPHPDGRTLLVLAGGCAYLVDPEARRLAVPPVDDNVQDVLVFAGQIVFVSFTDVTFLGPGLQRWRSPRLAWDGLKEVRVEGTTLLALGWDVCGEVWRPVEVDLRDGCVLRSAYQFEVMGPPRP